MKNFFLIASLLFLSATSVAAATLTDALKITFQNNLELQAERKNLEVQKEVLNISKSDFFPTLTLSGTKSFEDTNKLTNQDGTDASITNTNPMTSSIKLEQLSKPLLFSFLIVSFIGSASIPPFSYS